MTPKKETVISAMSAFITQRPGMDPENYQNWSAYRSEARGVTADMGDALQLLRAVEWRDSIDAETIVRAGAGGGRLTLEVRPGGVVVVDYCAGQYYAVEYRRAAARFLAGLLWDWTRECAMPDPEWIDGDRVYGPKRQSGGDWLREHFRKEFGRRLASRYFN